MEEGRYEAREHAESRSRAPSRVAPRKKKRVSGGRVIWGIVKGIFVFLFTVAVVGALTGALFFRTFMKYVDTVLEPEMDVDIQAVTLKLSSTVYYQDRDTGDWIELTKLHGSENRTIVDYEQIPDHVVKALIAVEDKRFYEHKGVDWLGTAGQVRNMLTGNDVRGASTITQQVIKNVTGNNQVTIRRKILEIFQALRAHENYSNEEILETYFNLVYYGDGAYGIEAAAETYFGKHASELDVAEGAAIVGITQYPYMYDPSRGETYRKANKTRQEWVLKKMWEQEYLTEKEYEAAKAEKLVFVWDADYVEDTSEAETSNVNEELDSFFVEQVYRDVVAAFKEQRGYDESAASLAIYNGGFKIYCTMDRDIQELVETIYADRNNFNYPSKSGQQLQSGMTVIDNATGNIVAIAGRVGERKGALEWSYAANTTQCGSAIKPLSVYAPSLEAGVVTAASVIDDYPVMDLNGSAWPVNAYLGYHGLVTIQYALQQSSNTCAVRTLMKLTMPASYAFMTEKLGFTTLSDDDLVKVGNLGLGGTSVNTIEMAAAYATFANNGVYTEPRTFIEVRDANGNVVIDNKQDSWVAMKETTVYTINELLKGVMRSGGTGYSAGAPFSGMTQAGKTGTTNSKKDRYFCGYTPYYTTAVWSGYDTPERIEGDANPSALAWKMVMSRIHDGLTDKDFPTTSDGMNRVTVCNKTGLLAGEGCGETRTVLVPQGMAPALVCDAHTHAYFCSESGLPVGEHCPEEEREIHWTVDLTAPNTAAGFGYTRQLLYKAMTGEQFETYAAQVEAGTRESMPDSAPIYARDSAYVMSDIATMGVCTIHLTPGEETEDPLDSENPLDPTNPEGNGEVENPVDWFENPLGPLQPIDPNNPTGEPTDGETGEQQGEETGERGEAESRDELQ